MLDVTIYVQGAAEPVSVRMDEEKLQGLLSKLRSPHGMGPDLAEFERLAGAKCFLRLAAVTRLEVGASVMVEVAAGEGMDAEPSDDSLTPRRCQGRTRSGAQCKRDALPGSDQCGANHPE